MSVNVWAIVIGKTFQIQPFLQDNSIETIKVSHRFNNQTFIELFTLLFWNFHEMDIMGRTIEAPKTLTTNTV